MQVYLFTIFRVDQLMHLSMILSLLFLVVTSIAACPNFRALDHSSCNNLYMTYLDSTCTTFSFSHCDWTECGQWYYYYDNYGYFHSGCLYYHAVQDNSWFSCTTRCCDSSTTYNQTSAELDRCQKWLDEKFRLTWIITLSVICGILGLCGIFGIILCLCKKCRCFENVGSCEQCCQKVKGFCHAFWTCKCIRRKQVVSPNDVPRGAEAQLGRQNPIT